MLSSTDWIILPGCKTHGEPICRLFRKSVDRGSPVGRDRVENAAICYRPSSQKTSLAANCACSSPPQPEEKKIDDKAKQIPLPPLVPGETEPPDFDEEFLEEWERDFH